MPYFCIFIQLAGMFGIWWLFGGLLDGVGTMLVSVYDKNLNIAKFECTHSQQ